MRLIKMLGLAAMAAMVATAFVGASTASATTENIVLCKKAVLKCETADWYPNPLEIHAEATDVRLLANGFDIVCDTSLIIVTLLNELAPSITGHLLKQTLSGNCHEVMLPSEEEGLSCTVTTVSTGGLLFQALGAEGTPLTASVTAVPLEEKETEVSVKCSFFINCTYSASEETVLTAKSDEAGHFLLLAEDTPLEGVSTASRGSFL